MMSHDLELEGRGDRVWVQQSWPRFGGLTHGAQTTAWPAVRREAAAHEGVPAPHDARFQRDRSPGRRTGRRSSHMPRTTFRTWPKLTRRTGTLPRAARARSVARTRTGQDQGGDFLRASFHGVALQQRRPAQLPFDFAKIQFVLPATGIHAREFQRRRGPHIEQAGPQAQLVRAARPVGPRGRESRAPRIHCRIAAGPPALADRHLDEPTAIAEPCDQPRLGRPRGAQQEMTADARARRARVDRKGRHAIQAIAQQQGAAWAAAPAAAAPAPIRIRPCARWRRPAGCAARVPAARRS